MDGQQIKDGNGQDEINLIDIMRTLWQQKIIILATTFIGLLIGLSYILFTKPVYEVTAYVHPPTLKDFSALNQGRSKKKDALLTTNLVKDVYGFFSQSVLSESTKWDFYKKSFLPIVSSKYSPNEIPKLFSKSVIVKEISNRSILSQTPSCLHDNSEEAPLKMLQPLKDTLILPNKEQLKNFSA